MGTEWVRLSILILCAEERKMREGERKKEKARERRKEEERKRKMDRDSFLAQELSPVVTNPLQQ